MTDATALRLAKKCFGENAEVRKDSHHGKTVFDWRCNIIRCSLKTHGPFSFDGAIVVGSGPTWEHAFIRAGVKL